MFAIGAQASFDLVIPKQLHVFLIGKEGKIVKEIMESTTTTVHIPKADDPSNIIRVAGTTENIRLAVAKLQLIADEKAKKSELDRRVSEKRAELLARKYGATNAALVVENAAVAK